MCDYSLHAIASRPAKAGEMLVSTRFSGTLTRGFAAESQRQVAVCLMPGTELAFNEDVKYERNWIWPASASALLGSASPSPRYEHGDALEFPDGKMVLLTALVPGQRARVIQLPQVGKPKSEAYPEESGSIPLARASSSL
jgi:hypothetical protein